MSTDMTWQMHSTSSEDTEKFGEHIGAKLRGGETIELAADLGGGKTTLVRGLVRGAGCSDVVSSPTFTLSKEYGTDGYTIVHIDLYRLAEAGVVADELAEYIGNEHIVTVVEWASIVQEVLPKERLTIHFVQADENSREISCIYPASLSYLIEGFA